MNKVSVKDHRRSSLFKSAVHPTITIAPPQPVSLQLQGVSEEEEDFSNGNIQQAVSNNGKGTTVEELIRRHNENKENEEESSVDESSEEGDSADRGMICNHMLSIIFYTHVTLHYLYAHLTRHWYRGWCWCRCGMPTLTDDEEINQGHDGIFLHYRHRHIHQSV